MNVPGFPLFKIIDFEDREIIEDYIRRYPSEACEVNFTNIFIWRKFEHSKYTILNGNLCILCEPPTEPAYFLPPLGEEDLLQTVRTALAFAPRLSRVTEKFAGTFCGEFRCEPDPDNFDYVYLAEDLAQLKGKKYDGKRNRIRKFERSYLHRYVQLTPEHLDGCRRLFEEWCVEKENSGWVIHAEKEAIWEALDRFQVLGLRGGAVEIDGKIEAFSIGEKFLEDTAVVHIEIANPKFVGLAQLINQESVRREWASFRFINREQDVGIPGLRRAKQSYHPHHLVKKFNVWKA
ncbi:MAG TPA: phosphatidylglycerol lysyltransferase domain-containing protein [Candidatus Aminicenantes bacterium]|nr:phosphatidylglycerol lysyltransferase domain-containing protein [Candidatus Aminicenantes bacterium]